MSLIRLTTYVAKDGKFYPRAMIGSHDKHGNTYLSVSADVIVPGPGEVDEANVAGHVREAGKGSPSKRLRRR